MCKFDPSSFSSPIGRPTLMGSLPHPPQAVAFIERFGKAWKRTPVKGCYYLSSVDGKVAFTCQRGELAIYLDVDVKAYHQENGVFPEADIYEQRNSTRWKYDYLQLLDLIKRAQ